MATAMEAAMAAGVRTDAAVGEDGAAGTVRAGREATARMAA